MSLMILPPNINSAKRQAREMMAESEAAGNAMRVSESLERLAHNYDCRDWNTMRAMVSTHQEAKPLLKVTSRVAATYLGHKVTGRILGCSILGNKYLQLTIDLDEAVDVVKFSSFSSMRKRLMLAFDKDGCSIDKTGEGKPRMTIDGVGS